MNALKSIPDMAIIPEHPLYIVKEISRLIEAPEDIIGLTDYYGDFEGKISSRYVKESWRN